MRQPAARAFLNRLRVQAVNKPKQVGPPSLESLAAMPADQAQNRVPEIHYAVTDIAEAYNSAGQDQRKGHAARLSKWAKQARRVTQGRHWRVELGEKGLPASKYYDSLIREAERPTGAGMPVVNLAPFEVTAEGGITQQRRLRELAPPPKNLRVPAAPPWHLNADSMEDLEKEIRGWYRDAPQGEPAAAAPHRGPGR